MHTVTHLPACVVPCVYRVHTYTLYTGRRGEMLPAPLGQSAHLLLAQGSPSQPPPPQVLEGRPREHAERSRASPRWKRRRGTAVPAKALAPTGKEREARRPRCGGSSGDRNCGYDENPTPGVPGGAVLRCDGERAKLAGVPTHRAGQDPGGEHGAEAAFGPEPGQAGVFSGRDNRSGDAAGRWAA